jgi:DNA excision repair protein ERCC-3
MKKRRQEVVDLSCESIKESSPPKRDFEPSGCKDRNQNTARKEQQLEVGYSSMKKDSTCQLLSKCTTTSNSETERVANDGVRLKVDHANRPLWVCPNGHLFLETFSPIYKPAYDFLIAIAEPLSRPSLIHEYRLTPYSLYAAASLGLTTEDILTVLDRLSKVHLPTAVVTFIRSCTRSYGKVKLVLQRNRYFVESVHRPVLELLLRDECVRSTCLEPHIMQRLSDSTVSLQSHTSLTEFDVNILRNQLDCLGSQTERDSGDSHSQRQQDSMTYFVEINPQQAEKLKRRCIEMDYPLLEEYDFRKDTLNPNIRIDLKPTAILRPYQQKSLSKMFNNGRARSGIIALPCGAGKSLVGIAACATIKKRTVILCTSSVAVEQWRHQLKLWTNVDDAHIVRFTATTKDKLVRQSTGLSSNTFPTSTASSNDGDALTSLSILITTYSMVAFGGRRAEESEMILSVLENVEWGLAILDEVHVVPAKMFRNVLTRLKTHCKLGLTATLVREDTMITDLNFLIGPKLYEANWQDLARQGHIAQVQCAEVWCPMTSEFYREYLRAAPRTRRLLYTMNPNKFVATQYLITYHEARGDKILVFSDNLFALKTYAKHFNRPFIYGATSLTERMRIFAQFQYSAATRTIFLSKVGDNSIDLPEANVIIQISSHYGSRRQEAQRLGRILRPKTRTSALTTSSSPSLDTHEMYYSTKRQQFLIDQGYSFKALSIEGWREALLEAGPAAEALLLSQQQQLHLLTQVLATDEDQSSELREEEVDALDADPDHQVLVTNALRHTDAVDESSLPSTSVAYERTETSLTELSGGMGLLYMEYHDDNT